MAKDPYQYFRIEARELLEGLTRGLLALEKSGPAPETIALLLRQAHTLKGAARVVKQIDISRYAHALEEVLTPYRGTLTPLKKEHVTAMLGHVDAMSTLLERLGSESAGAAEPSRSSATTESVPDAPKPAAHEDLLESVRIRNSQLHGLQQHVHVAGIQLAGLAEQLRVVKHAVQLSGALHAQLGRGMPDSSGVFQRREALFATLNAEKLHGSLLQLQEMLSSGLERIDAELTEIGDVVDELRLRPARSIFGFLERAVRDAAQVEQKNVEFHTEGGEHRLDAHILAALRDVLIHVVRNAVAHGIESEAQRTAAGKPQAGTVRLTIDRRGSQIIFRCHDDGKGIDAGAVRKAAIARGLLSTEKAAALDLDQLIKLVLQGGLSTTPAANEVSGRGIGMDVARATIARLKGTLELRSTPGVGTCVEMCVPISLASVMALRLEAGARAACIPLERVRSSARILESELVRSNDGTFFVQDGRSIPYIALSDVLKLPRSGRDNPKQFSALILESEGGLAALGADRLRSTAQVVVQTLPGWLAADDVVMGAFLNEDGEPELLLDAGAIVKRAYNPAHKAPQSAAQAAPHILVIDDSLTTRMLEQSILESAGYRVDLAVSAEEGLEKARANKYALFLVDVEMPGMSGFEFVEHVQTQPNLRETPCILVTSRNALEDRARGERAGARAYIVKSEFNQDFLLEIIRGLTAR